MTVVAAIRVWLVLLALTALSCAAWIGAGWCGAGWVGPRLTGSLVIALAMAKAWLIATRFMELRDAWWPLRVLIAVWTVLVGTILLFLFGYTP